MEASVATAWMAGPQFWVLHGKTMVVKTSINKCVLITYSIHLKVAIAIIPYPLFSFKASAAESKYCAARVTANSAKLCRNQKAIYLSSSFFLSLLNCKSNIH